MSNPIVVAGADRAGRIRVLTMSMSAQSTSIEPVSELLPFWAVASFEAPTVAVLWIVPQSSASVRPETLDRRRRAGRHVAEVAVQDLAVDRAGDRAGVAVLGPVDAGREVVGQGDVVGDARAEVLDDDRERRACRRR